MMAQFAGPVIVNHCSSSQGFLSILGAPSLFPSRVELIWSELIWLPPVHTGLIVFRGNLCELWNDTVIEQIYRENVLMLSCHRFCTITSQLIQILKSSSNLSASLILHPLLWDVCIFRRENQRGAITCFHLTGVFCCGASAQYVVFSVYLHCTLVIKRSIWHHWDFLHFKWQFTIASVKNQAFAAGCVCVCALLFSD